MNDDYLRFLGISKNYPGVKALDDVSFGIAKNSIKGLMGENGAGKSTLLRILAGAETASSGEVRINGQTHVSHSPKEALDAGIAVIYQELNLVPEMSVAENLLLGHFPTRFCFINHSEIRDRARHQLRSLGENFSPDSKVKNLSIGQCQMVEIAKALMYDAQIIAFDEPTSSLSQKETRKLFQTIRTLKDRGRVILYVSHRMEEIFELCDNLTILRDGRLIRNYDDIKKVTRDLLITDMVGRSIKDIYGYRERSLGKIQFEAHEVSGAGIPKPQSFQLKKGEILGFFGLVGAGRTELVKMLSAASRMKQGTLKMEGKPLVFKNIAQAIRNGVMLCPEDRKHDGIIPVGSVAENINLSARRHWSRFGIFLNQKMERQNANTFIERLRIKTPDAFQLVRNLSGGNQQKVILARWLGENIKVLLMDEPTRGIDVGAKHEIYNLMYELADQGVSIIMVSSDLAEILGVSDRIIVMRDGTLIGELSRDSATQENIMEMALPVSDEGLKDVQYEY